MTKKCVLHIGAGKAGSSSVQKSLHANRLLLAESGLVYPYDLDRLTLGGDNNKALALMHAQPNFDTPFYRHQQINKSTHSEWKRRVLSCYRRQLEYVDANVVLSGEQFWSELTTLDGIGSLRDTLVLLALDVTDIIVYVRRQDDWLESFAAQKCREKTFRLGVFNDDFAVSFARKSLDYLNSVALWKEVFGDARIHVRPFERTLWVGGSLLEDFYYCICGAGFMDKAFVIGRLRDVQPENTTRVDALSMYAAMNIASVLSKSFGQGLGSDKICREELENMFESAHFRPAVGVAYSFMEPKILDKVMSELRLSNLAIWEDFIGSACPWYHADGSVISSLRHSEGIVLQSSAYIGLLERFVAEHLLLSDVLVGRIRDIQCMQQKGA